MDIATASTGETASGVSSLGECLRRLNLSRPAFALCACEYRTLRKAHVSGDFTQTDAGCVGCTDLGFQPRSISRLFSCQEKHNLKLRDSKISGLRSSRGRSLKAGLNRRSAVFGKLCFVFSVELSDK